MRFFFRPDFMKACYGLLNTYFSGSTALAIQRKFHLT